MESQPLLSIVHKVARARVCVRVCVGNEINHRSLGEGIKFERSRGGDLKNLRNTSGENG